MPVPTKKYLEENRREEWVQKVCIPYVINEGYKSDVAVARCYDIWDREKKKYEQNKNE